MVLFLQLADLIREHIGAEASALVSLVPLKYETRDLVLVKVPRGINWYYLDNIFYIRRSGSTISLQGHDLDRFRREFAQRA
jgi:hypothetical protein